MSRFNRVFALAAGLAMASGTALADPSSYPYDGSRDVHNQGSEQPTAAMPSRVIRPWPRKSSASAFSA